MYSFRNLLAIVALAGSSGNLMPNSLHLTPPILNSHPLKTVTFGIGG